MTYQELLEHVAGWDAAARVLDAEPRLITLGDMHVYDLLSRLRGRVVRAAEAHPEGNRALTLLFACEGNRRWMRFWKKAWGTRAFHMFIAEQLS